MYKIQCCTRGTCQIAMESFVDFLLISLNHAVGISGTAFKSTCDSNSTLCQGASNRCTLSTHYFSRGIRRRKWHKKNTKAPPTLRFRILRFNWPQAECADAACPPASIIRPPVLRTVCNHPIQSVFFHIKGNGVWLRKNFQPRLEGIRWLSVFAAGGLCPVF